MRIAAKPLTLGILLTLALAVRIFELNIPFLEPFNNYSRQSMCASVARNFYTHGFNLFYPEIDENGSGPSLYNVEMPLYSYVMALGYKLVGGVHEAAARSVSVAFSILFLVFLYLLIRRRAGETAARWALGFAALSPMVVALSRSIQPDITMLSLCMGALYFFARYRDSGESRDQVVSAVFMLLAVLTRPFALYMFVPIAYLAWEREGIRFLKNPRHYAFLLFVCLALSWYVYMWFLGRELQLAYEPYRYSPATGSLSILDYLKPQNLSLPAKAVVLHLLTPLGAALFIVGLTQNGAARRFFLVWLGATGIYLLLIWRTAVIHPYYFLPLAGPMAYFVGRGCERIGREGGMLGKLRHPVVIAAAAILICSNLGYYYRLLYFVPADRYAVVDAGAEVNRTVPKEALVIAAYHTSPIQLYYTHRRGWTFDLTDGTDAEQLARMEALVAKGASYFVTTELETLKVRPALTEYLSQFVSPSKTDRYWIVRFDEALR